MHQVPFRKCTTTVIFGIANNDKYLDVRCIEQLPSPTTRVPLPTTLEDPVDVKFHVATPNIYGRVRLPLPEEPRVTSAMNNYRRRDRENLYFLLET